MDDPVVVRSAEPGDEPYAGPAARLIAEAAAGHDMALRPATLLREKIRRGRAALALEGGELVGFGYWSEWEGGRFVSHSGLVVRPDRRGRALGRRMKAVLFESSRRQCPRATLMSLTSSPAVRALNRTLGFETVPLDELTRDPEFWDGCRSCRNYGDLRAHPEWCRCVGMVLRPGVRP